MNYYPRSLEVPGSGSFLLCGARGTGKSSWLAERFPGARVIDFHQPRARWDFLAQPSRLLEVIGTLPPSSTVILDEVPPIPSLLLVVDALLERRPGPRVVVCVSHLRHFGKWQRRIGRAGAVRRELLPLTAWELGNDFSLEHTLTIGTLPAALAVAEPSAYLTTYLDELLTDEVEVHSRTRDPVAFRGFLETVRQFNGEVLNLCKLAREAGVHRKVAENYLNILCDLFLVTLLPPFRLQERPAVVRHPKLYLVDAGILRALTSPGPTKPPSGTDHSALLGLIALHLRACLTTRRPADRLYFWRTLAGTDVDFVVDGPAGCCAIVFENTAVHRLWHLSSLVSFRRAYPEAHLLLLHSGRAHFTDVWIRCVPLPAFLAAPWEYLPGSPHPPAPIDFWSRNLH